MKLNKVKGQIEGREASKGNMPVFKPVKNLHRVRFIPVRENEAFWELSSIELGGSYYTLPFRKTKQNESKDPNNYYSGLIQPVYGVDQNMYSKIKQRDKYIFFVVEVNDEGDVMPHESGEVVQVFFPSPGLGHTIVDGMLNLDGVEPFDNPGVAFKISKGKDQRTGFPDYSKSSFENKEFDLDNWESICKEAWEIPQVKLAEREEVELALRNQLGGKIVLPYKTLTNKDLEKSTEGDEEDMDDYEKKLLDEISKF